MSVSVKDLLSEHLKDRYVIHEELGRGSMGVVYLASDERLGRQVAIKTLNPQPLKDPKERDEMISRFQREAKALARISHKNLVTVFEAGVLPDQQHYMVMEHVSGSPLSRFVSVRQKLSVALVASIGLQVCAALQRIHQEGIIHRDVKPSNMILSEQGVVKLTDFGVACFLNSLEPRLTQQGDLMGSLLYCAPEQIHNAMTVDARTDIYALGVSLYELVCHTSPYQGKHVTQLTLEIASPLAVRDIRPNMTALPDSLAEIIEKAMAKSPADRFQTAEEMGQVLEAFIRLHLSQKKIVS